MKGDIPIPIKKRRCEITIISFSRSICRGGLAALIGVTGKPYPNCLLCHSHPIRPCGAPSPRGEGCDTRILSSKKRRQRRPCEPIRSPSTVIPSAAEGSFLHGRHMHACALTPTTPWCFPLSPFSHPRFTGLPKGSLHFGPHDTQERRIVSHPFSYRCVELCLSEALYPAPSARAVWPHRKAP